MLCGVEEALDVQQLRCGCRIEGFEDDFKELLHNQTDSSEFGQLFFFPYPSLFFFLGYNMGEHPNLYLQSMLSRHYMWVQDSRASKISVNIKLGRCVLLLHLQIFLTLFSRVED